ncbi:CGNR zinc finger domain-containing protein [Jeotgalibacillus sp. JSM ZJ347]|uniref:CGNR zinc finger domain-containing protein n=1 Tax=Jeotgalibacillus sp. JSM ZJ347 TaxID=3342117 RepID=UPI0035A98549
MTLPLESSAQSPYLFIHFVNTINYQHKRRNDLLLTENDIIDWLIYLNQREIITTEQLSFLKQKSFSADELTRFRDQCRLYLDKKIPEDQFMNDLSRLTSGELFFEISEGKLLPVPVNGGNKGLMALLSFYMLKNKEEGILSKVSACQNEECFAYFINQKGRRKWCSMQTCGNRLKARAHYERNKTKRFST